MRSGEKNSTPFTRHPEIEDEINLIEYLRVVRKRWKLIVAIVVATVLTTALLSLFMTNIYRATAVITPVESRDNGGSKLALMAQQFGGVPGVASSGTTPASEITSLLRSKAVRKAVIERHNLLPALFADQWDEKKQEWKRGEDGDIPTMWDGLRMLDGIISVRHNFKENMITLSADYRNPEMAARLISLLLATLNEHMSSEARRVAETNKSYLEEELKSASDPLIRQKIYGLIALQVESALLAGVKENFAFKVIDPPMIPDVKVSPQRKQMVLIGFFLSLCMALVGAFVLEYFTKAGAKSTVVGTPLIIGNADKRKNEKAG